ncbi:hypothetical protein ACG2F4_05170 [Halalkalibaculum sp. DA3122]|uniref:hypothetical protein n=1 Tax=Halalkalibaculum sp. DA3122 TaxID=3373607 RepID=UPI0037551E9C
MKITKQQLIAELKKQKENLDFLIEQVERIDLRKKLSERRWLTEYEIGTYLGIGVPITDHMSLQSSDVPKRVIGNETFYDRFEVENLIKSKLHYDEELHECVRKTCEYYS